MPDLSKQIRVLEEAKQYDIKPVDETCEQVAIDFPAIAEKYSTYGVKAYVGEAVAVKADGNSTKDISLIAGMICPKRLAEDTSVVKQKLEENPDYTPKRLLDVVLKEFSKKGWKINKGDTK